MKNYDPYMDYKRPKSKHAPMTMENRAAQFLPFSALTGYDEAIERSSQVRGKKPLLSDDRIAKINDVLQNIRLLPQKPLLEICYFDDKIMDFITVVERFKTFNMDRKEIVLEHQHTIFLNDIIDISIQ